MEQKERLEILRLKAKQNGELIIIFLLDGKRMELENMEFEKRFGEITEYQNNTKGVNCVG